jgi:ATP-dependent RNA helicase DeaD
MHPARVPSQDEVLQVLRRAGIPTLRPFQEKLIPHLLRGKDVAAERVPGAGTTVGFLVTLVLGLRGAGAALRALILVSTPEETAKVAQAYARLSRVVRDAPQFVPLGEIEDARREQRRLEKGANIVVGTTERVIDHIRRGGIALDGLETIVVEEPAADARADFIKDVQFIFAKIADRRQTVLFSRSPLAEEGELLGLLRHPVVIPAGDSSAAPVAGQGHLYIQTDGATRTEVLARVFFGNRIASALVYHSPRSDSRRIADALTSRGLRVSELPASAGSGLSGSRAQSSRRQVLGAFSRHELDVVLLAPSPGAQPGADLEDLVPSHVVFFDLPAGSGRVPGVRKGAKIIALVDKGQEKELGRLQEAIGVAITKGEIPGDDDVLSGAIDKFLSRMKEEDPAELGRLRRQIRSQVPLFSRPLFMASLLKTLLPPGALAARGPAPSQPAEGGRSPRSGASDSTRAPRGQAAERPRSGALSSEGGRGPRAAAPQEAARAPRGRFGRSIEVPPEAGRPARGNEGARPQKAEPRGEGEFTQLFVSIGRNRRVYARDLTALFTETLQLAAGEIGDVRVFEKYSFVDIVPSRAGEAITKLSGTDLKGRTITVNYAKKKEEKEER